jgi:hypothetical protein
MSLVHGVRLMLTELNGARPLHNLFCDDVAPLRGLGKKERVIRMDVLTISEPAEAATRLKLPYAAFDVESEGVPRDACVLPQPMIRGVQNLDVLRVRVPGGPGLRIDEIREGGLDPVRMSISLCAKRSACSGSNPLGHESGGYATRRRR